MTSTSRRRADLEWSRPWHAARLIATGATFGRAYPIALFVGTLLSSVNQGVVLATGHGTWLTVGQVAMNYLTPYVVASVGLLSTFRRPQPDTAANRQEQPL